MKKPRATAQPVHEQDVAERHRMGVERLTFFSDAVFAIAVTVLVLDIHLPAGADTADNSQLAQMLGGLWHQYFAYVLSFWVIGLFWISHHRKFLYIKRFDGRLLSLNLLFLMVIAFIPFPTSVLSESGTRTATIFYALVMALAGMFLAILWRHAAHHHKLTDPQLDQAMERREVIIPLATSAIFLISIGLSFWATGLVRLFWILILPVSFFLGGRRRGAE